MILIPFILVVYLFLKLHMLNLRFFVGWIMSAIVMYAAFYTWHGVLSTDFYRIQYPKGIFMVFSAVAYLVISFVLFKVYELKFWKKVTHNLFAKGLFSGVLLGFLLFAIVTVLGVGFSQGHSLKILCIDLVWQLIEQTLGGMIVALAHLFVFVPEFEEEYIKSNKGKFGG